MAPSPQHKQTIQKNTFSRSISNLHLVCLSCQAKEIGDVGYFRLVTDDLVVVSDNEMIKKIFGNRENFQQAPTTRLSVAYSLGGEASMFSSEGEVWKTRHRILEPMQKLNFLKVNFQNFRLALKTNIQ